MGSRRCSVVQRQIVIMDAALLLGDDPYRYPDNLPVVAAKAARRQTVAADHFLTSARTGQWVLVANTGFGTGVDMRPNPGIGFPGTSTTCPSHAQSRAPSFAIRCPAPGPIPYPGAPP